MLPLLIISICVVIGCLPLMITSKGRTKVAHLRMTAVMKQFTKKHRGKLIRHVNLPQPISGKETDFDHVLVTTFGIFVIKLIVMDGKISGSKETQVWSQLTKKGKNNEFTNPLLSDDKRINKLSQILGINNNINSIVVFVKGNIKAVNAPVFSIRKFYKALKAQIKNKVFTKEEVVKYAEIVSQYKDKQYIDYVASNKCPKCNQPIKLIKKKKAYVLSCSNQECKYKVKIK